MSVFNLVVKGLNNSYTTCHSSVSKSGEPPSYGVKFIPALFAKMLPILRILTCLDACGSSTTFHLNYFKWIEVFPQITNDNNKTDDGKFPWSNNDKLRCFSRLVSAKYILPNLRKEKCKSDVVRIGSIISHLRVSNEKPGFQCDVIFSGEARGNLKLITIGSILPLKKSGVAPLLFSKWKLLIDVSEYPLYATKAALFTQINVEKTVHGASRYYISYSKIQQYCGTLCNCIEWRRRSVPSAAIPYPAPYVLRVGHARKTSKGLGTRLSTRLVSGLLSLERMRSRQTRRVQRDINKERS